MFFMFEASRTSHDGGVPTSCNHLGMRVPDRVVASAAAVAVTAGSLCTAAGSTPPPLEIRASANSMRLGSWRIADAATYADGLRALGPASSCRLVRGDPAWAVATWQASGVRVELRTYGAIPAGKSGCS